MKHSTLCSFCVFALMAVCVVPPLARASDPDRLYREFVNPPREFSPMPFWFWNGKMDGALIQKQIRDMVDQHVYGAFLHARDGLQTPYLSEEWFRAIGAGLEESRKSGFQFNFVDEYDWPGGEVRNVWMTGNHQSEVLARRPDLRMKTLAFDSRIVTGPRREEIAVEPESQAVVAARWLGDGRIDDQTLTLLDSEGANEHTVWSVPDGQWVIMRFNLKEARGFDGGFVDLMDPDTTSLFFDLVYGEYHRRFPSYFGSTIRYSFSDHEGDYGYRIAWTPKLFEAFQRRAGYDLHKMLPLLIFNGGDQTTKVRTDYLATVTDLYGRSFWQGITHSAAAIGLGRTGHGWEESLQWAAALEGSLFTVERGLNPVGVDSLFDFGRQSLNFKVAQSVADFEGRRFMCENQGVQGTDSYLDMEAIRRGTNAIGAWGVNLFVPHAFDYDAGRANYPPDWLHQPYWPYFHYYADYVRRISYMNAESHHITSALLYYPITSIWADTAPLFSGDANYEEIGKPEAWKNRTILVNDYYTRIILGLSEHQWDYDIADDEYLQGARVENKELVIGPQHFKAVILPPMTTLSRTTLAKLQEFHRAGGLIFGIRLLPTASPEAGDNDPGIETGIKSIFGIADAAAQTAGGLTRDGVPGTGFYIENSVDALISALDANVARDVQITSGANQHLYFQHRSKLDTDYYWVVNDTAQRRINEVHFAAMGTPEKWSALTGEKEPLFYTNTAAGTDVRLALDPWDAFYVVFGRNDKATQNLRLESTNADSIDPVSRSSGAVKVHVSGPVGQAGIFAELRDGVEVYRGQISGDGARPLQLGGSWKFRPAPDRISVPYARVSSASAEEGNRRGWLDAGFDDGDWPEAWLNESQNTIRTWKLIGPFPNQDNQGFATAYPPEQEFDPNAKYNDVDRQVSWEDYDGNEPHLALEDWGIWMKTEGGRFSDSGYIVTFDRSLVTDSHGWIVSYAHTYLYSPRDQHAQFIVAADNWAAVWLNHKKVFAQLRTPFWYELNDNWADRIPVELHKGWNEILVKVDTGRGTSSGYYGFSFRVADEKEASLPDLVASNHMDASLPSRGTPDNSKQWYRLDVPPGCTSLLPPHLHHPYDIFLNGRKLQENAGSPIDLRDVIKDKRNVLVIVTRKDDPLVTPIEFLSGETEIALQSLTRTGLANFSGTAVYTRKFNLPDDFRGKPVVLDLGRVSSVADVFVNDKHAGTLVWSPYRLEISQLLQPGTNTLRIAITNTEANRRAVGPWRHILKQIEVCGLEGPVELIPYVDGTITLHPVGADRETSISKKQETIVKRDPARASLKETSAQR